MARAQRPKPKADQAVLVLELAGRKLTIDVDSFTIPESSKMNACIKRIMDDASEGIGARPNVPPDVFVACAAYVVALRAEPTLTFEAWFDGFTMRDLQKAITLAKPEELDSPEA